MRKYGNMGISVKDLSKASGATCETIWRNVRLLEKMLGEANV